SILADDKPEEKRDGAATTKSASKVEAPAPLTERERWLLNRVEQLEKRVADLESSKNPVEGKSAETPAPSAGAGLSANNSFAPAVEATATSAGPAKQEAANLASAAKPAKAEPFSFADYTWLNGNARTKDIPLDTKFFTPEIRFDAGYVYDFNHPK